MIRKMEGVCVRPWSRRTHTVSTRKESEQIVVIVVEHNNHCGVFDCRGRCSYILVFLIVAFNDLSVLWGF